MPGASRNLSPLLSICSWMRTPLCWRPLVLCMSAICHWPLTRRISACCREICAEGKTMSLYERRPMLRGSRSSGTRFVPSGVSISIYATSVTSPPLRALPRYL